MQRLCDRPRLFELAGLYATAGKARSAVRLYEEVADLFPEYRKAELEERMREARG